MVFKKTEPTLMPRQQAAAAPVAPTPQMEMPQARPVIAAPQPQQQPTVQPDAVPQPAAPQQPAVQTPQAEMPTGQPYTDYMRKPDIQPDTPVSVVPPTVPQEQIQSQRLDQMKGAPVSVVPAVPEPNQEPLQTKALEQANPGYWQKYGGINWNANGGDFFANLAEANIPIQDAIKYYDAFQKDNGGEELNPWEVWARYGDKDFSKSVKQQEEEDKKLERQHKWEKIGDAFTSLANLWGTMRGAPNIPLESGEALTKRQQEQVDRVRTLRQAAGKRYLDALQAKRADEFKRRQLDAKEYYNKEKIRLQQEALDLKDKLAAATADKNQAMVDYYKSQIDKNGAAQRKLEEETRFIPYNAESRRMAAEASKTNAAASSLRAHDNHATQVQKQEKDEVTTKKETDARGRTKTIETTKSYVKKGTADESIEKRKEDATKRAEKKAAQEKAAKEAAKKKAAQEAAKKQQTNNKGKKRLGLY
ncbi:MAG: hypothetical protein J6S52_02615 [Prevotella sp.]|nr:hypothetical protein [Prevotella sp.]